MQTTQRQFFKAALGVGVASLALVASPAFAQASAGGDSDETVSADGDSSEAASTGSIVVTGSRIARPELESVSPVTTVGAEQVELTGTVTVESLINDLPQVIPGNNRSSNNSGGENFATLDLRGLGPQRTLILVDGERLAASSTTGVVDVSQIPTALIERIDVVTGGATAVYGSDAMAGVINFILKDDFQGAEITGQTSIAEAGVGFSFNVQGLIGGNFDDGKGNVTISASYFDRDAVSQSRFGYSRTSAALAVENGQLIVADSPSDVSSQSNLVFAGGSATNPFGTVIALAGNPFRNLSTLLPGTFAQANLDCNAATAPTAVNAGQLTFNTAGQLTPRAATGLCQIPVGTSSRFNFAPSNYLIIPFDRLNVAMTARYDITDDTELKIYGTYARTEGTVNLAPTPAADGTGFIIPADSPLIPADLRVALNSRADPTAPFQYNRRFFETGPRVGINENQSFQIRGIVDHQINDKWSVNMVGSFGRTDFDSRSIGNINRTAVEAGLNGCRTGGTTTNPGFGVPQGCVPVNIFGFGALTPAMVNFIQTDTFDSNNFEQVRVAANLTGSLFEIVENDPVGIAVGVEYRKDSGAFVADDAKVRGEIIGFNQQNPLAGSINVKEAYGEIRIPVLGGGSFPNLLAFEAGARISDYSSVGRLFNYKLGAEFAPFDWLKFRGAYNKAARAPSVFELFQAGDQGFPTVVDPCNDTNSRTAAFLAQCQAQAPGFNFAGFQQSNTQVQAFAFGNPDLQEERAKTYTFGAVLNPRWFPIGNFTATVDYYNIKISNLNQALGASFFLSDCFNNAVPDSCGRIVRSTATGQITQINTTRLNSTNILKTSGIDAGINWTIPMDELFGGEGRIRIANLFTYVDSYKLGGTEFVGTTFDGIGGTTSKYANTLTVGYEEEKITGQVRWVYKSGGNQDNALFGNDDDAGFNTPKIPDLSVFDASLRYRVSDAFSATFIVENIFDKYPPQTATGTFEQANTNVSFYDPYLLGRTYTVQATVRF